MSLLYLLPPKAPPTRVTIRFGKWLDRHLLRDLMDRAESRSVPLSTYLRDILKDVTSQPDSFSLFGPLPDDDNDVDDSQLSFRFSF